SRALIVEPDSWLAQISMAEFLAQCPDPQFRDPARAVQLAKKAVEKQPSNGAIWNTLGGACYRARDWLPALKAFRKSVELRSGGDSEDFFFLAMTIFRLGDKTEARKWYVRGVKWMDKNKENTLPDKPKVEDLFRFRAEAAALLGIKDAPSQKGKEV